MSEKPSKPFQKMTDVVKAIKEMFCYATDKGVIIPLAVIFVLIIFAFRVSPEEIPELFNNVISIFKDVSYLGWIFFIISVILWIVSIWFLNKVHDKEMARVTLERNKFQEIVLGDKIKSSSE